MRHAAGFARLHQAHFAGAVLDGAHFAGADLGYADLRHARLHRADLRGATLVRACLHRAMTEEAQIDDRARALETDPQLAQSEDWRPVPV